MPTIDELKRGTYRGISFFYRSASETGGFKTAEHLYPGSDNFVVEQLGKVPRRFQIEAQVEFSNRDRFDNALNTAGSGILSHPMYGNFIVKVIEYTKTDSINNLGLYDYSVQYVVEQGLIIPTIESVSLSAINNLRAQGVEKVKNFIKTKLDYLGVSL